MLRNSYGGSVTAGTGEFALCPALMAHQHGRTRKREWEAIHGPVQLGQQVSMPIGKRREAVDQGDAPMLNSDRSRRGQQIRQLLTSSTQLLGKAWEASSAHAFLTLFHVKHEASQGCLDDGRRLCRPYVPALWATRRKEKRGTGEKLTRHSALTYKIHQRSLSLDRIVGLLLFLLNALAPRRCRDRYSEHSMAIAHGICPMSAQRSQTANLAELRRGEHAYADAWRLLHVPLIDQVGCDRQRSGASIGICHFPVESLLPRGGLCPVSRET